LKPHVSEEDEHFAGLVFVACMFIGQAETKRSSA